jgi:hypothetical protein
LSGRRRRWAYPWRGSVSSLTCATPSRRNPSTPAA